ncbi:hypothetical protein [Virgibacillus halodenitrificans]|uniref:hypothetical protein n=1 Tax=Virgibacillus halodenitrificans TaxID=1482 RepID=UPI000EF4F4C8|nr:hypothetical protein [Virgibacillus halodenitrificans]
MAGTKTGVDYGTFNEEFFRDALEYFSGSIHCFNRKFVLKMDEYKRAEIVLVTNGVHDSYAGYQVDINHKDKGKITTHTFLFGDYFDNSRRIDNRLKENITPHIYGNTCRNGVAEWYINRPHPDEINKLANRILQFIEIYR